KPMGGNMKVGIAGFGALLLAVGAHAQVASPPPSPPARSPLPSCTPSPGEPVECRNPNAADQTPAFPEQTRAPYVPSNGALNVATLAEGLAFPWGLALMPDGRFLVTEKAGTMRIVSGGALSPPVEGL